MKHHYIPQHYLKRWTAADGRLFEYQRPRDAIVVKRKFPVETGYVPHLYTIADAEDEGDKQKLELQFWQQIDQFGADCIALMLDEDVPLPPSYREKWTLYLLAMIQRNPEKVAYINNYAANGYLKDYVVNPASGMSALASTMMVDITANMKNVTPFVMQMDWAVFTFDDDQVPLMTSDRPVIISNGLDNDWGHIVLPLNSRRFFMAYTKRPMFEHIKASMRSKLLPRAMNRWVVEHAYRYAYGVDGNQSAFVNLRMRRPGETFLSPTPALRCDRDLKPPSILDPLEED